MQVWGQFVSQHNEGLHWKIVSLFTKIIIYQFTTLMDIL